MSMRIDIRQYCELLGFGMPKKMNFFGKFADFFICSREIKQLEFLSAYLEEFDRRLCHRGRYRIFKNIDNEQEIVLKQMRAISLCQ